MVAETAAFAAVSRPNVETLGGYAYNVLQNNT